MFGGDADAVVGELHGDAFAVLRAYRFRADVTAGRGIFDAVLEEDAQELTQENGVCPDDCRIVPAERDLMRGRDRMHLLHRVREQLLQIHVFHIDGKTPLIGAREEEQFLDELLHIIRLGADGGQALLEDRLVLTPPTGEDVRVAEDDRQRRAQFVRGVRDKTLLLRESFLQTVEHAVERAREFGELVACARYVETPAETFHLNAARRPCNLSYGF